MLAWKNVQTESCGKGGLFARVDYVDRLCVVAYGYVVDVRQHLTSAQSAFVRHEMRAAPLHEHPGNTDLVHGVAERHSDEFVFFARDDDVLPQYLLPGTEYDRLAYGTKCALLAPSYDTAFAKPVHARLDHVVCLLVTDGTLHSFWRQDCLVTE